MLYKWLWVSPNHLDVWNGQGNRHHLHALQDMVNAGLIQPNMPGNYFGGEYSQDTFNPENPKLDRISSTWEDGVHPTLDEMKYMLRSYLDVDRESRYEARVLQDRMAATVEDSEPAYNNGFMKEPHKELYPCAWGDDEKMLPKAKKALLNHVLNSLEEDGYPNADSWIAFSVYGSGASYNWDEDGDFDVQMWVDVEKYNTSSDIMDPDDLLAAVRRSVQKVNFPSFEELELDTPDCEGRMLIQFYPKLGKGTEDENLASKPYACYSIDDDEWYQHPEPIEPTFYGEQFLLVMPKAQDIAIQAEALLGELERNTVNWQFWSGMFDKWGDSRYDEQAQEAKTNAEDEKEGVKVLFKGVFGGRQEAYSPEGRGIKDERDIIQKLLEVWGIFQRLKHFARQELPWEEQELPKDEVKDSSDDEEKRNAPEKDSKKDLVSASKLTVISSPVISHKLSIAQKFGGGNYSANNYGPASWQEDEAFSYPFAYIDNRLMTGYKGQFHSDLLGDWLWEKAEAWGHENGKDPELWFSNIGPEEWDNSDAGRYDDEGNLFLFGNPTKEDFDWAREQLKLGPADSDFDDRTAKWDDIMDKARRLKNNGQVFITNNGSQHVEGQVVGDHGTYDTQFDRMDPSSQAITTWNCTCPWGEVSWGRTRQWKKYEGRPCAHTLAMFWASQSQPPSDQGQQQLFQQTPQNTLPSPAPGGPNLPQPAPMAPVGPQPIPAVAPGVAAPPPPPPASSKPTQPGDPNLGPLGIPGALSKLKIAERSVYDQIEEVAKKHKPDGGYGKVWFDPNTKTVWWQSADWTSNEEQEAAHKDFLAIPGVEKVDGEAEAQPTSWMALAAFQNGEKVKARFPMWGVDRDERAQMIPAGSTGEVLFSDDRDTIAIFPLDSGQLQPHLVRVQDSTQNFIKGKGKTPFVRQR